MAIFEKYHPIMSAHYTLDWLTVYKAKDVMIMRQDAEIALAQGRPVDAGITQTAHFINRAMALVMDNHALLYGIGARQTGALVGTFGIFGFSTDRKSATVRMATLPATDPAVLAEVLPRMLAFATYELKLERLLAGQIVRAVDRELYLQHHFVERDGALVLDTAAIRADAKYRA